MKKCPFCAEEIQDEAIKCKHCGEWLEKDGTEFPPEIDKRLEINTLEPQPENIASLEYADENNGKEPGQKQCPTCGKWDVYRTFVEIGVQSDYCPHCKRPIEGKPWIRFWARHCDYIIFYLFFVIVGYATLPSLMNTLFAKGNEFISILMIIFIYNFAEAGLLSSWGYTPSKWLLGITVRDKNMNKLSYEVALTRAIRVWWRGMGIGFPSVYIFTQINAYNKLKNNGITTWDNDEVLIVTHSKLWPSNIIIIIIIYAVYVFLITLSH